MQHTHELLMIIVVICLSYSFNSTIIFFEDYFRTHSFPALSSKSGKDRPTGKILRILARKFNFSAVFFGRKYSKEYDQIGFYYSEDNEVHLLGDLYKSRNPTHTFIVFHELGHVLSKPSGFLFALFLKSRAWFDFITEPENRKLCYPFFIIMGLAQAPLLPLLVLILVINCPFIIIMIDELLASSVGLVYLRKHHNLSLKQTGVAILFYIFAFSTYINAMIEIHKKGFLLYTAIILFKIIHY
jgi:hypothetical protein